MLRNVRGSYIRNLCLGPAVNVINYSGYTLGSGPATNMCEKSVSTPITASLDGPQTGSLSFESALLQHSPVIIVNSVSDLPAVSALKATGPDGSLIPIPTGVPTLSKGGRVGIIVGAVVGGLLLLAGFLVLWRRLRHSKKEKDAAPVESAAPRPGHPELDGQGGPQGTQKLELPVQIRTAELAEREAYPELHGDHQTNYAEISTELDVGHQQPPSELETVAGDGGVRHDDRAF